MPKKKELALNSGIHTNQILTTDDEVCIPRLSRLCALESVQKCQICTSKCLMSKVILLISLF